ncbi:MAG: hypothetical protein MK116_02220 [Phycisphaerales bacterium]|nr:hypothetical protein [Phycisphaerales bacterium]
MNQILQAYIKQTEATCPSCSHRLSGHDSCDHCGDRICLALEGEAPRTMGLRPRWCLVFIPWFLSCLKGISFLIYRIRDLIIDPTSLWNSLIPSVATPTTIMLTAYMWLLLAAPLVCLLLWWTRHRAPSWPTWFVVIGCGLGSAQILIGLLLTLDVFH